MRSERRNAFFWPVMALVWALLVTPWFGTENVWPTRLADPVERDIFVRFRLTRVGMALFSGAALSLAGCLFQATLRNPLASPYTLGVSGGAALGAVVAISVDASGVWLGALVGAVVSLLVTGGIFAAGRRVTAATLILAGVSLNSICAALIMTLHNWAGFSRSFAITTWLVGAIEPVDPSNLLWFAVIIVACSAVVIWRAPYWDLLAVGEAWAASRGVEPTKLLLQACAAGSVLTAATVSMTGPIGFVGLLVPHLVRPFTGSAHRRLLPASFLAGGAFLLVCDAVSRTLLRPSELPVGVITALVGAPALLWILHSGRGESVG